MHISPRLLLTAFVLLSTQALAADPAPQRVPVAALIDLAKSPITALLETKLLASDAATWVERTEIDRVVKEQELQAAFGAVGVKERSSLGKLLKADVLILVREVNSLDKKSKVAECIVCETRQGLRLKAEQLPIETESEPTAAALEQVALAGLLKSGEEIRGIVAVPPLMSDDLGFQYNYLQTAYAKLIEQVLLNVPGVVVVELQEAQVIAREFALAAEDGIERPQPLTLLGNFRHSAKGDATCISINLRALQGTKEIGQAAAKDLLPPKAPEWLRTQAAQFLKLSDRHLTAESSGHQAEQLAKRASEFMRIGNWEEALPVAEASLLLEPNQIDLHVIAAKSLGTAWVLHRYKSDLTIDHKKHDNIELKRAIACYLRYLTHIEAFHASGGEILHTQGYDDFVSFAGFLAILSDHATGRQKELVSELQEAHCNAMIRLFKLLLKTSPKRACWYVSRGSECLPGERGNELRRDLILAYQGSDQIKTIFFEVATTSDGLPALNRDSNRRLLDDLAARGGAALKREVATLRRQADDYVESRKRKQQEWAAASRQVAKVPEDGVKVKFEEIPYFEWHDKRDNSRGKLLKIDGLLATEAGFDIVWSDDAIYFIHGKGDIERIFKSEFRASSSEVIDFGHRNDCGAQSNVCFDGKYVWAVLYRRLLGPGTDRVETRLLLIEPGTKRVTEVTQPHDLSETAVLPARTRFVFSHIAISPIAPGKVLAIGYFGRTWIGTITYQNSTGPVVKIFHECKTSVEGQNSGQWRNTDVVFGASWIVPLTGKSSGDRKSPLFLVGRDAGLSEVTQHALIVDAEAQGISVMEERLWFHFHPHSVFDGNLFTTARIESDPSRITLKRIGSAECKVETLFPVPKNGFVFAEKGLVHIIERDWWIVDLSTKQVSLAGTVPRHTPFHESGLGLGEDSKQGKYWLNVLGRSNHYGILAVSNHVQFGEASKRPFVIEQISFTK